MLIASWSTFRDRWPVFVGAIVIVAVGVALVQASLLALVAAATESVPNGLTAGDEAEFRDGLTVAIMTLGMTVGISLFVACFVVGSTFSFTVAERHRDFGLLRLIGTSPRQVSMLLLGEAVLLGCIGTTLGVLLGFPVLHGEVWMLTQMKLLPAGMSVPWQPWILAASMATGTGIAVIASLAASRRAAGASPLQAVRNTDATDKVMSRGRWTIGIVSFTGGVALLIATAVSQSDPLETSLPGLLVLIIALTALSPLLVPLFATVIVSCLTPLLHRSPMSELSHANIRAGVRRTASTAAPVIVFVALVTGFAGTINVVNAGFQREALKLTSGDVIVTSVESLTTRLESVSGVRSVSEEVELNVSLDAAMTSSHFEGAGLAVDPTRYQHTHSSTLLSGNLSHLRGNTVALQRNFAAGLGVQVGDTVRVGFGGSEQELQVVATIPYTLSGPRVLLPLELLPDQRYNRRYIIEANPGTTPDALVGQIRALLASAGQSSTASVSPLREWVLKQNEGLENVVAKFTLAVLGLVSVYMFIAMVNAVVISTAARRAEFGIARLTGLTRLQVVWMTLIESLTVASVGTALGIAAAAGTIAGATVAVSTIVGARVMVPPWELAAAVSLVAAVTVGLTTVVSTFAATRQRPVFVVGSRE